jgi:hypothetical protein
VETDETNNVAEFTFIVADVDLVAERAYLRTGAGEGDEVQAPTPGQAVFLHVDYQLNGTDAAVAVDVRALIDDEVWCFGTVELDPGANGVLCQNEWVATSGDHVLRWEFDYPNFVTETDETNNTATLSFHVGGATGCTGDCNGDGVVATDELVRAIQILLGLDDLSHCEALDADNNGNAALDEAVLAVDNAINECRL